MFSWLSVFVLSCMVLVRWFEWAGVSVRSRVCRGMQPKKPFCHRKHNAAGGLRYAVDGSQYRRQEEGVSPPA